MPPQRAIVEVRLRAAIEHFYESEMFLSYVASTQVSYRRVLGILLEVCGNIKVSGLTPALVDKTMLSLRNGASDEENARRRRAGLDIRSGRDNYTLNIDRGMFRKFIEFLHLYSYMSPDRDPTLHLKNAKRIFRKPIEDLVLTVEQVRNLLAAAEARHPRDRAAFAVGIFAGLRPSEIVHLQVKGIKLDVDPNDPQSVPTLGAWRPKIKDWHYVPISLPLEAELIKWFTWYKAKLGVDELDPDWYVIPARPKNPGNGRINEAVTPETGIVPTKPSCKLNLDTDTAFANAGIRKLKGMGPHTFRRTAACMLLAETGDIRLVQAMLGHQQQQNTEMYVRYRNGFLPLASALRGFSPLDVPPVPTGTPPEGGNVISLDAVRSRSQRSATG